MRYLKQTACLLSVLFVAAGAVQDIPEKLQGNSKVLDILEAIRHRDAIGERVLIWGHAYGSETAISLAREGKDVILFGNGTRLSLLGFASNARRWWLMKKLSDIEPERITGDGERVEGVEALFQTRLGDITQDTAEILFKDGASRVVPYDTFIVARARKRGTELFDALQARVPEVHAIGDYDKVNVIQRAVFTANEVVRSLDSDLGSVKQLTREPDTLM